MLGECQTVPDPDILERALEYLMRFRRELRHGPDGRGKYEVAAAVINLTGPPQNDTLHHLLPGTSGGELHFKLVTRTLSRLDAAVILREIAEGRIGRFILCWVPLMQGGGEPGTIEDWRRCAEAEPDSKRRGDYGGLALVFAELTGVREIWKKALEGWNVQQSQQVLEWQAEARAVAEVETWRTALLDVIKVRFPVALPEDFLTEIQDLADLKELIRWHKAAATAPSLDAFRHTVHNGQPAKP